MPWRRSPTMRPKVKVRAVEISSMLQIESMFDQAFGFSKGCAALTLKKPPPLVPSCLMASWLATGPSAIVCLAPSSVVASTLPASVCGTPVSANSSADDDRQRQQHVERRAGHIDPEVAERLRRAAREGARHGNRERDAGRGRQEVLHGEAGHLHEMAHGRLAAIGLPVGVGHEADRRVEGEVGRDAGEALRIERQHGLQAQQRVEQQEADRIEGEHGQRVGEPGLLLVWR